jgi:hypothetical protein
MVVKHITGAIGIGKVKGEHKRVSFRTKFLDRFEGSPREMVACPEPEVGHLAQESVAVSSMVDSPNLLLNRCVKRFVVFLAAVANLEKGVQKALNDGDRRK